MPSFSDLILNGVRNGYSDFHMTGGHPLVLRKHGVIHFDNENRWSHRDIDKLVDNLLTPLQLAMLKKRRSVDFAKSVEGVRTRINIFSSTRGLSLAVRLLPGSPPTIENLNLHPCLHEFCKIDKGLVLICGSSGNGKSTTTAAMIEEINRTRSEHIVTLEDPIEYRFVSRRSFVEQRELGGHFPSFAQGLLDVLREDADVVVVGELREPETMRLTIDAAEAGHLVLASMHASDPVDGLYRICNAFPSDAQDVIRAQLSSTLKVMILQQLVQMDRLGFRVPQLTIVRNSNSVKGIIRENRLSQLEGIIQTSRDEGMFTAERYRQEFLDSKQNYVPPAVSFKPSTETTPEVIYHSPVLGPESSSAESPAPVPGRFLSEAPAVGIPTPPLPQGEVILQEDASYEDLIAEFNRPQGPA